MNRVKNRVIHPYFSDIDLVIFGAWSELPLRTIERELLDRNIASPENLKVLDRAAVSSLLIPDKIMIGILQGSCSDDVSRIEEGGYQNPDERKEGCVNLVLTRDWE